MTNQSGFYKLGIAPNILVILDKLRLTTPTPIQEQSIPQAINGKDIVGIAQTGTGKTLAFGIPMIQAALRGKQGLVILPTRELAFQVSEAFQKIGGHFHLRMATLVGGEPIRRQMFALQKKPKIIIGTPGRIIDHLEQKNVSLNLVSMLVLDEADRMLDMGFAPQLKRILQAVPRERQTMLFSATMPQDILTIARSQMKLPIRVEIAPSGTMAAKVTHELFFLKNIDKPRLLEKILGEYKGATLVFSRTKHGARKIASAVRSMGHTAAELHSDRSLGQRREALEGFRNGRYRVLAATDIAARGIDVKGIELVVNYDIPQSPEDYVHRIGRTGRAGGIGHAISFATFEQRRDVRDIERLIRSTLPLSKLPELPPARILSQNLFASKRGTFPAPYSQRRPFSKSQYPPSAGRSEPSARRSPPSAGRSEPSARRSPRRSNFKKSFKKR